MKTIITAAVLAAIAGCASTHDIPTAVDLTGTPTIHQMSRAEVIAASMQCQDNGMRANVVTMLVRMKSNLMEVPIDVQCQPVNSRVAK